MNTQILGGWSPYSTTISQEEADLFNKVKPIGVQYTPLAVSTQVVEGKKYLFFCNAQAVYPRTSNDAVIMEIDHPVKGEPHIVSITKT